jgi:hypothetical protein
MQARYRVECVLNAHSQLSGHMHCTPYRFPLKAPWERQCLPVRAPSVSTAACTAYPPLTFAPRSPAHAVPLGWIPSARPCQTLLASIMLYPPRTIPPSFCNTAWHLGPLPQRRRNQHPHARTLPMMACWHATLSPPSRLSSLHAGTAAAPQGAVGTDKKLRCPGTYLDIVQPTSCTTLQPTSWIMYHTHKQASLGHKVHREPTRLESLACGGQE